MRFKDWLFIDLGKFLDECNKDIPNFSLTPMQECFIAQISFEANFLKINTEGVMESSFMWWSTKNQSTLQALAMSMHSLYRAGRCGGRRWFSSKSGRIELMHRTTPSMTISVVKSAKDVTSSSMSLLYTESKMSWR